MEAPALDLPIPSREVIARNIAGETVLVPIKGRVASLEHLYLLNPVAALLWRSLDGVRDRAALCALVRERFAVPAGRDLEADVARFLAELTARGLAGAPK